MPANEPLSARCVPALQPRPEPDIAVVGSLNIDLTARVHRHPAPGETVRGSGLTATPGGKGANQAVAAARLGAAVAMLGRVGDDHHAEALLGSLRDNRVDTAHVVRDPHAPTGTAVVTVDQAGENSIVLDAGANARTRPEDVRRAASLLAAAKVVSLVPEIPGETVCAAARQAHRAGVRVVLNLSPVTQLPADVLRTCDPLVVNEQEARELASGADAPGEAVEDLARSVLRLGARSAVVTRGARGATVATADTGAVEHVPAVAVEPHDTTGAGDAFAAALAWRLGERDSLPTAARWAAHVSALAVRRPGAQPSYPTLDAVTAARAG
ncbi:ribokinase [Salinifilum aidingensis]